MDDATATCPDIADFEALLRTMDWAGIRAATGGSSEPCHVYLRTLAGNLAALARCRPAVYAAVMATSIDEAASQLTRQDDASILGAFDEGAAHRAAARPIGVAGIGDGSLVRALARFAPELPLGRQQELIVIEPDVWRLLDAFGQTDLTGPRGPIEQPRVAWYVGADWARQYADELLAEPTRHPVDLLLPTGELRPEIAAEVETLTQRMIDHATAQRTTIADYYASLSDQLIVDLFSPAPPRRPRVLLLTSRFTTVLQYSTRDAADAFERLGWDAHVLCEPQPWHNVSKHAIRSAVADLKPDLVFQIDHLRHELGDLLPANLPFVCWIQDHLPNLANAVAGAAIGEREFVLTGATYRYVNRHGYPRRQCVDMAKVSRQPTLPASWPMDGEDLFYVSHWSQTPEMMTAEACARVRDAAGPNAEMLCRACCVELARAYADGSALRLDAEVRSLVQRVCGRLAHSVTPELEQLLVDELFQRLNNAFFRQQALAWAGQIADELGLKFGIYGKGWDAHPQLGRWARGPITYGPELEDLTRRSKILLQLEPYPCYTHQRMLDGLLAGGFVLVRDHPWNILPITIRSFLDAHVPASVNSVEDARACLSPFVREQFDALLGESTSLAALGDVVDVVRGWQRGGILGDESTALPHLPAVSFDSLDQLRERVRHFTAHAADRVGIADDQRRCVEDRLTYVSALRRALRVIHERLHASLVASPIAFPPRVSEAA